MYMEKNRLGIGRGGNHLFKCPICLEDTEHEEEPKVFQLSGKGTEYSICPFCYHVIQTLRKKKTNFKVEIQKW